MGDETYYQKNRKRALETARKYRELNREEINRKQRERYANNQAYREFQKAYHVNYNKEYGRNA